MSEVLANGETLRAAAKCGDTLRVVSLLNSVTSEQKYNMLMLQESDGDTAISLAALRGHTETVKAILDSVTSDQKYNLLMLQDTYGITAILCAALYGHTETVEAILKSVTSEQKYNILMFQDSSGNTAISYATCKGHIETVKAILESVATEQKYNMLILQNRYGDTAISRAAVYGLTEKVKYILYSVSLDKRHKMLKIQNTDGYTSLHHAASQGHVHTFRSIIASLSTEQRDALLAVRDRNGLLAVEPNEKPPLTQEVVVPTSADVTAVAGKPVIHASPNYIEKLDEPKSLLKKESSRRDEKPRVPAIPKRNLVRRPDDLPPNYIQKVKQLESFKEKVSSQRAEIQRRKTSATGEIKELQRELTVTLKDREEVTQERNEWKCKCNKLEIELYESKQELKRKDELICSLSSAQADLAFASKALTESNTQLQALLSDKKDIEYDLKRTSAELEDARTKVRECEERLQELRSKERATTQEREHLERKLEAYTEAVEKLEKKQLALDQELETCQREKEKILNKHALGRSVRDAFPQVTTLAKQAEDGGEQEAGSFSEYGEPLTVYGGNLESDIADVDIETAVDKDGIKAQPCRNVYTQEITKEKEINTRFGREIKADVVSVEVDMIRADEEIFTKEIENLVADVETETTDFAYIQGETNEVEINNPYEGGIKEPKDSMMTRNIQDVQIELDQPQVEIAENRRRDVDPVDRTAELEARITVLPAKSSELEETHHRNCCFPFNCFKQVI